MNLDVENGGITRIYAIRNPHRLGGLDGVAALTRSVELRRQVAVGIEC